MMRGLATVVYLTCSLPLLVVVSGCSRPVGPTSGVVRFHDDSVVTSGSVEFRRVGDQQRFASRIDVDGTFEPTDQNGVIGLPPGSYEVVVVQLVLTEDLASEDHDHGHTVPRRYADYYTSDLKVTVVEGQKSRIELVLDLE